MNRFDSFCNKILEEAHSSGEFDRILKKIVSSGKARIKDKKKGVMVLPNDRSMQPVTLHRDPVHGLRKIRTLAQKLGIDEKEEDEKDEKERDKNKKKK